MYGIDRCLQRRSPSINGQRVGDCLFSIEDHCLSEDAWCKRDWFYISAVSAARQAPRIFGAPNNMVSRPNRGEQARKELLLDVYEKKAPSACRTPSSIVGSQ